MAPHKSNYVIFSNSRQKLEKKISLTMYDQKLEYNPNPTFLGITFDQRLTFKKQVDTIIRSIIDLIRSIIDYSSFILTRLSKKRQSQLQTIQNAAIRAIYRLPYDFPSEELDLLAKLPNIKERMREINVSYIKNAILNENKLFEVLFDDYQSISTNYLENYKTFLCDVKNDLI